jgi:hypothetical protein
VDNGALSFAYFAISLPRRVTSRVADEPGTLSNALRSRLSGGVLTGDTTS